MERSIILVTGGAGFIGSHLVDALVERGHRVRILDVLAHREEPPQYLNPEAEFIHGNVCDSNTMERALDGVDIVYHEAAEVSVGESIREIERYVRSNNFGTATLLEAIVERRDRIRKLVVASSISVYGEGAYECPACDIVHPSLRASGQLLARRWEVECPTCGVPVAPTAVREDKPLCPSSVYAITKQVQEQMCLVIGRAYRIPTVALRYCNVYGERQVPGNSYTGVCAVFSSQLLSGERPIIFEDGEQTRDFIHVTDVVQANLLAVQTDKADYQALNVGTGTSVSVNDVTKLLAAGLGTTLEPEVAGRYREGDVRHCVADISRARELLGYEPKVTLRQGIAEVLDWARLQVKENMYKSSAELPSMGY